MKTKRFSAEQIVAVSKQVELALPIADRIRQVGISEQRFFRWRKQYAGLQSDPVRALEQQHDIASEEWPVQPSSSRHA